MPTTALAHFGEDVARARAIVAHADPLPAATPAEQMLRSDLLRNAWMFSVGALDAYFCDAYTDIVAATIISKSRHPALARLRTWSLKPPSSARFGRPMGQRLSSDPPLVKKRFLTRMALEWHFGLGITSYGLMSYVPLFFNRHQPMYVYKYRIGPETLGLGFSEIEIMLLIISRYAGVFLRKTLKPSVLSLTECHSFLTPFLPVPSPFRVPGPSQYYGLWPCILIRRTRLPRVIRR